MRGPMRATADDARADSIARTAGVPLEAAFRGARDRRTVVGRFRATASGSDRPMRVVRRSASLVPAASLSGHSRIGAGQIKADALRDFRGGSPQVDLTNSLTRRWEHVADATGVAYRGYARDQLRIAKGLSGRVQHGEFAGSPSRLCYKHSCACSANGRELSFGEEPRRHRPCQFEHNLRVGPAGGRAHVERMICVVHHMQRGA
jgi:hypothetical protein